MSAASRACRPQMLQMMEKECWCGQEVPEDPTGITITVPDIYKNQREEAQS